MGGGGDLPHESWCHEKTRVKEWMEEYLEKCKFSFIRMHSPRAIGVVLFDGSKKAATLNTSLFCVKAHSPA